MNLDDNNYLPEEEQENNCAYCGTSCENEFCTPKCFVNSFR